MTAAVAQQDALDQLRYQAAASMRPDAGRVAVVVAWRGEHHDRRALRILAPGSTKMLATIDTGGIDHAPAWSPDGTSLAFVSDRAGGVPQLFLADGLGRHQRRITDEERGVIGTPMWSPDGRHVALAGFAGPTPDPSAPRRIVRAAWRADGLGLIDENLTQVLVVPVDATEPPVRLTDGNAVVRPLAWAPDGSGLLAALAFRPDAGPGDPGEELVEVQLNGTLREFGAHRGYGTLAAYLDDGAIAYVHHLRADVPWGSSSSLWLVRPDGAHAQMAPDLDLDLVGDADANAVGDFLISPPVLLTDGRSVVVRAQRGASLGIYRITLDGDVEEVAEDAELCRHPIELHGDSLLHACTSLEAPASLVVTELGTGLSSQVDGRQEDERPRLPRLQVRRGATPCPWWFIRPTVHHELPCPTVLVVHGGPFSAFGETFFPTVQRLAGAGFGVVLANPSGSRGYGEDVGRAVYRDWGGVDADELLAVVDQAVDLGLADPHRLGITGASYGGYMSCLLAARTRQFAAAVADVPVTDLVSERGTSDLGTPLMSGYFGEDEEAMRRSSPITYAAWCTTPTLLLLGLDDHRCPPTQGIQFYTALREAGCPAEMLLLPGSSHWGGVDGPVAGRRAQEAALVEWFLHHLSPQAEPIP